MKIRINDKNFENVKLTCGVCEDYFDLIESIQATEEDNKMMDKAQRQAIKEFLVSVFGCGFTTTDIDEQLEFADLIIYFKMVGEEIGNKTQKKFEKLGKS